MKMILDIIGAAVIVASLLFLMAYLVSMPIDDGGEVSRLATAGILRGAA